MYIFQIETVFKLLIVSLGFHKYEKHHINIHILNIWDGVNWHIEHIILSNLHL